MIRAERQAYRADGRLTWQERAALRRAEIQQSRRIYLLRRNYRYRY